MIGEEHREEILALKAAPEKFTDREIGEFLGIPHVNVWRIANPEDYRLQTLRNNLRRRGRKAEWEIDNRGTCTNCGRRRGLGQREDGLCIRCKNAEVSAKAQADRTIIARMYRAGATYPEIAKVIGTTRGAIKTRIQVMRELGYDLPYRKGPNFKRPRN